MGVCVIAVSRPDLACVSLYAVLALGSYLYDNRHAQRHCDD